MTDPSDPIDAVAEEAEIPPGTTLRIPVEDPEEFHGEVEEQLAAIEAEDRPATEHVRAFETVSQLRRLMTDQRIALVDALLQSEPESVDELAGAVGRATEDVESDLQVLADESIVKFERESGRIRPTIPYETVHIDVTLSRKSGEANGGELSV